MQSIYAALLQFDDTGWWFPAGLSLFFALFLFPYNINIYVISGFVIGSFYEHTIEFSAHKYLQHGTSNLFKGFRMRHYKHHKNPQTYHAFQPISVTCIGIVLLLSPCFYMMQYDFSKALISGFLFSHFLLHLFHYDLHAAKKILPRIFRNTGYYQFIVKTHDAHHNHGETFYYSITCPYSDWIINKSCLDHIISLCYNGVLRLFERNAK